MLKAVSCRPWLIAATACRMTVSSKNDAGGQTRRHQVRLPYLRICCLDSQHVAQIDELWNSRSACGFCRQGLEGRNLNPQAPAEMMSDKIDQDSLEGDALGSGCSSCPTGQCWSLAASSNGSLLSCSGYVAYLAAHVMWHAVLLKVNDGLPLQLEQQLCHAPLGA